MPKKLTKYLIKKTKKIFFLSLIKKTGGSMSDVACGHPLVTISVDYQDEYFTDFMRIGLGTKTRPTRPKIQPANPNRSIINMIHYII
jgi:hypothetical protein